MLVILFIWLTLANFFATKLHFPTVRLSRLYCIVLFCTVQYSTGSIVQPQLLLQISSSTVWVLTINFLQPADRPHPLYLRCSSDDVKPAKEACKYDVILTIFSWENPQPNTDWGVFAHRWVEKKTWSRAGNKEVRSSLCINTMRTNRLMEINI